MPVRLTGQPRPLPQPNADVASNVDRQAALADAVAVEMIASVLDELLASETCKLRKHYNLTRIDCFLQSDSAAFPL